MNYYNEIDSFAAAWLRELIKAGHIPNGDVDERSIEDVRPSDLSGYTQCHFFAGIGGWSYALRLAGWPEDRTVWTGSCPCQPFSSAGQRKGTSDERHLWPSFFHLISERKPETIFGEQVEAAIRQGWLDLVQTDLEGIDYAVAAQGIAACNIGAPHIRKRLYFVADSKRTARVGTIRRCDTGFNSCWGSETYIACRDGKSRLIEPGVEPLAHGISNGMGRLCGYGNAIVPQVAATFIRSYLETIND